MTCEPELDAMDPDLVCPVCLDMLYEPFMAQPCKHVFCETCLRRLGSKNAMDTNCPMCRQRIAFCQTQPGSFMPLFYLEFMFRVEQLFLL